MFFSQFSLVQMVGKIRFYFPMCHQPAKNRKCVLCVQSCIHKSSVRVRRPSAPLNHGYADERSITLSNSLFTLCSHAKLFISLSPTTTHYNAPFHTHAHLLRPSPVRADACHGSSDVSCLQSCRSRCSAAALPAGLM